MFALLEPLRLSSVQLVVVVVWTSWCGWIDVTDVEIFIMSSMFLLVRSVPIPVSWYSPETLMVFVEMAVWLRLMMLWWEVLLVRAGVSSADVTVVIASVLVLSWFNLSCLCCEVVVKMSCVLRRMSVWFS